MRDNGIDSWASLFLTIVRDPVCIYSVVLLDVDIYNKIDWL